MNRRRYPLGTECFLLSIAVFAVCLAETLIRWDAMAGPVRIIIRLISYGKLSFREVYDAVRPDLASLLYPLWVLMGALCGLMGAGAVMTRRNGAAACAACFLVGAATFAVSAGTALHAFRLARACLLAALGCLFLLRILVARRRRRLREREKTKDGRGNALFPPREEQERKIKAFPEAEEADERPRLFVARERRRLFGGEKERTPLFKRPRQGKTGEDKRG